MALNRLTTKIKGRVWFEIFGDVLTNAGSPASSGPAGSHFEGQVGAHYLLSLLVNTAPRGLPGTLIDRIELQRAAEGHPLDDVIIHAHDARGKDAVLEIQVKRSIAFAPTDKVFRKVVAQIVEAFRKPDFHAKRYELAIATARTSRKIHGAYQDVLTWARQLGSAATFMARIERPGSANDDMRTFVNTFREHLREEGAPDDDETVWQLLRRLQILFFDFAAQGSESKELAEERAIRALHPDDCARAGELWKNLIELAIQIAASGGDRKRETLIEDLNLQSFRLAGERRLLSARAALAEASRLALGDIRDQVGKVTLTRQERIATVHAALDEGRYVEIRGDAGVGKSGVLKHFAEQVATEANVIVLSHGRVPSRGWTAMRAEIGFDGTARELLTDMAADGAAMLFLDGLDIFDHDERRTVVDLVREAAKVPGFTVIVTARPNFDVEEENWLPKKALDELGRSPPLVIGELSDNEVSELRLTNPRLGELLAENHPARAVTRNLFRLAYLASQQPDNPAPSTEIDMAQQWWRTADGAVGAERRERARLLKSLAKQEISKRGPLDVSDHAPAVLDALISNGTLRELGIDRVAFRHDVFREWAIANLLFSEPDRIERLPLERPAPTALARGVELFARMVIEHDADSVRWQSILNAFSREGAHGSWRRVVLLALVRSEIGIELLGRASGVLLRGKAELLRELVGTVMAVDVEPLSNRFTELGIDPINIPEGLYVPNAPSWYRLIRWLLGLGDMLPAAIISDIVKLYTAWAVGAFGLGELSAEIAAWFYALLTQVEAARNPDRIASARTKFGEGLNYQDLGQLETELRTGFQLICNRTPRLASEYLKLLRQRRDGDEAVRSVLKYPGKLAEAAPAELAELTAAALIAESEANGLDYRDREFREPFSFIDHDFLPASPAQGPFFALLTNAPEHGISLIHRLTEQAIRFFRDGLPSDSNAFRIPFPDGERIFPWRESYRWSREAEAGYSLTSSLMALEAWSHHRIEAGDQFNDVCADVLGPPGTSAAFVLIAVDLLLSHWPKSREAAVPFLACPELLCVDRRRQALDNFESPDLLGLKALEKEPLGIAKLDDLKRRRSRHHSLENLIGPYAVFGPPELRATLVQLLRNASSRLGPPGKESDLGDPAFMAVHALNLADPNNWKEVPIDLADGTQTLGHQYVPPERESRHLQPLQEMQREKWTNTQFELALADALDDPSRSSPEFAAAAVTWAQRVTINAEDGDTDETRMREQAVLSAAMIAMRDGNSDLRFKHETWARKMFADALDSDDDSVYQIRAGLRYNPVAIAFTGIVYLMRDQASAEDVHTLLKSSVRHDDAGAHGFGAASAELAATDERLPRSILRCAFAANIRPVRHWELSEKQIAARSNRHKRRVAAAIKAELEWLDGQRTEPDWPSFPTQRVRRRRGIVLPGGPAIDEPHSSERRPSTYVDHQGAALWLKSAGKLFDLKKRPWLCDLCQTYGPWTIASNGAGLDEHAEIVRPPTEWNDTYFDLLARCVPGLASLEVDDLALSPISSLPDQSFFDVATRFVRIVDEVYFSDKNLNLMDAVRSRSVLSRRLIASRGWRRLRERRTGSIEMHIGPAIAAFFFNDYGYFQPLKCYLSPAAVDRLDPFIPVLNEMVQSGPCLFVALVTLNLLEVSTRAAHMQFAIDSAGAWLANHYDDSAFWVDCGIGRRICALINQIREQDRASFDSQIEIRADIERLLAALVRLGVPEASRLEASLA